MIDLSVIIPVYKGEAFLVELITRLEKVIHHLNLRSEIILINDASPDHSQQIIQEFCTKKQFIKTIEFSRNFGQHYAIHAGLQQAQGTWIVVMDCDLQDQPEEIENLYQKTKEGYDIVLAQRHNRQDHILKKLSSKVFYKTFSYLTDTQQDASIGNFGIYHQKVIHAILSMNDYIRYFPAMVQWVGFNSIKIPVQHSSRAHNDSSYSFNKLLSLTLNNLLAFSTKPLMLTVKLGILTCCIAFLIGAYYLYLYFNNQIIVLGYASTIVSIWFLSGVIIFMIGILGLFIGKIFDKVKDRPLYIVKNQQNFDSK